MQIWRTLSGENENVQPHFIPHWTRSRETSEPRPWSYGKLFFSGPSPALAPAQFRLHTWHSEREASGQGRSGRAGRGGRGERERELQKWKWETERGENRTKRGQKKLQAVTGKSTPTTSKTVKPCSFLRRDCCDATVQLADGLSLRRGRLINGVIWRTAICFTAHMCVYSSLNDFASNYVARLRSSIMGDG